MLYITYDEEADSECFAFASGKDLVDQCLDYEYFYNTEDSLRIKEDPVYWLEYYSEGHIQVECLCEKNLSKQFTIEVEYKDEEEDELLDILITNNKTDKEYRIYKNTIIPTKKIPKQVSLFYDYLLKNHKESFIEKLEEAKDNIVFMETL